VNVKREVEIAEAINQALLRRQTGVRGESKNEDEIFLTEPTSLEIRNHSSLRAQLVLDEGVHVVCFRAGQSADCVT
jgi:hypothetical protein